MLLHNFIWFWTSYKWNTMLSVLWYLVSFAHYHVCEIKTCCGRVAFLSFLLLSSIPFYEYTTLHQFCDGCGYLGYFQIWVVNTRYCYECPIQIFWWVCVFSFVAYSGSGFVASKGKLIFNFSAHAKHFCRTCSKAHPHQQSMKFQLLHILANHGTVTFIKALIQVYGVLR